MSLTMVRAVLRDSDSRGRARSLTAVADLSMPITHSVPMRSLVPGQQAGDDEPHADVPGAQAAAAPAHQGMEYTCKTSSYQLMQCDCIATECKVMCVNVLCSNKESRESSISHLGPGVALSYGRS